MSFGLYIHIPFCNSRCPYCDFAFVVRKNHLAERYIDAVICELQHRIKTFEKQIHFDTVYFGGGTPSAIPPDQLARVLQNVHDAHDAEITAAGITTVFDSLRVGDEPGEDHCRRLVRASLEGIEAAERAVALRADHHIHLRCEVGCERVVED